MFAAEIWCIMSSMVSEDTIVVVDVGIEISGGVGMGVSREKGRRACVQLPFWVGMGAITVGL